MSFEHYRRHASGRPAIVFCVTVRHAELVAERFAAAGYRAVAVDGSMSTMERDRRIRGLANGEIDILTSCELIAEGLDVPGIGAVILLRPTQSLGLHLQQIGRVLRPKADGSEAVILDHAGNIGRHGLPCAPRAWSLDSRRKACRNAHTQINRCAYCRAIIPATCQRCPACGERCESAGEAAGRVLPATVAGDLVRIEQPMVGSAHPIRLRKTELERELGRCATYKDMADLGQRLGYKPGWAFHRWRLRTGETAA